VDEHRHWEKIPDRQEPVTSEIIDFCLDMITEIGEDSLEALFCDWLVLGKYTGYQLGEWAQRKQDTKYGKFAQNRIGGGNDGSSKAFILEDFRFFVQERRKLIILLLCF